VSSLLVIVTAYCLTGVTASGAPAGPGVVAVDPSVIPLGARVHVPDWGDGRALDTGGAIRGLHVDVWMSSCQAARDWGVRRRVVTVRR
jgi:3D (Asp-Asp-Asp) domain-containing protein